MSDNKVIATVNLYSPEIQDLDKAANKLNMSWEEFILSAVREKIKKTLSDI